MWMRHYLPHHVFEDVYPVPMVGVELSGNTQDLPGFPDIVLQVVVVACMGCVRQDVRWEKSRSRVS